MLSQSNSWSKSGTYYLQIMYATQSKHFLPKKSSIPFSGIQKKFSYWFFFTIKKSNANFNTFKELWCIIKKRKCIAVQRNCFCMIMFHLSLWLKLFKSCNILQENFWLSILESQFPTVKWLAPVYILIEIDLIASDWQKVVNEEQYNSKHS